MNTDKIFAEYTANQYSKRKESKVIALRKLDRKEKWPTEIFAYTNGIIMSLVLGVGMCLSMKVIGDVFILGIVIGIMGIIQEWILNDCNEEIENIINIIMECVKQ